MGKIIQIKQKHDTATIKLVMASNEIDHIILHYLNEIESRELIGLLAHRLGSFLRHTDNKEELWLVCEKILKRQAQIK